METLLSEQDSAPNQSFPEENALSDPNEINEQTFFLKAFELIQTLPIRLDEELYGFAIFKFIQISVNFWNQIIPKPQNEEMKYSLETFEKKSNEFAHFIHNFTIQNGETKYSQNSNSIDESVISLISECYYTLIPSTEDD
jgi:hypothetical protein